MIIKSKKVKTNSVDIFDIESYKKNILKMLEKCFKQ